MRLASPTRMGPVLVCLVFFFFVVVVVVAEVNLRANRNLGRQGFTWLTG
jgi:hypothetical protein